MIFEQHTYLKYKYGNRKVYNISSDKNRLFVGRKTVYEK
mgnify:CR=1 FL=1